MALSLFGLVHSRAECDVFTFPHCCCGAEVDTQWQYMYTTVHFGWVVKNKCISQIAACDKNSACNCPSSHLMTILVVLVTPVIATIHYRSLWLSTVEKLSEGNVTTSSISLVLCQHTPLILLAVGGGWSYNEHWMLVDLCAASRPFLCSGTIY